MTLSLTQKIRRLEEDYQFERAKNQQLEWQLERIRDDISGTLEEIRRWKRRRHPDAEDRFNEETLQQMRESDDSDQS